MRWRTLAPLGGYVFCRVWLRLGLSLQHGKPRTAGRSGKSDGTIILLGNNLLACCSYARFAPKVDIHLRK